VVVVVVVSSGEGKEVEGVDCASIWCYGVGRKSDGKV